MPYNRVLDGCIVIGSSMDLCSNCRRSYRLIESPGPLRGPKTKRLIIESPIIEIVRAGGPYLKT